MKKDEGVREDVCQVKGGVSIYKGLGKDRHSDISEWRWGLMVL